MSTAMAERPSQHLRSSGHRVVLGIPDYTASAPATHRGDATGMSFKDMTIQQMEASLRQKCSKQYPENARSNNGPQTARALLEENKQLIEEKQERRALARQNSKEEFEKLVVNDRLNTEGDKAQALSRRHMHRSLAQDYKAKIGDKEKAKASEYDAKVQKGVEIQYFPFVEGENIDKHRQAKSSRMRDEMRAHMETQRKEHPPRADNLIADTKAGNTIAYPTARSVPPQSHAEQLNDEASPHMARYPRFLSRAREHMSRRLHDSHVKKALEDKVVQTRQELEASKHAHEASVQQWEEGMTVNDALRYDRDMAKAAERRRNAEYLESQMRDRKQKHHQEVQANRSSVAGYWGPEEKIPQGDEAYQEHCANIVQQMEVDQQRRCSSRNQRLRQEKQLLDNCMAEMSQDRAKERQKHMQHREVLTTTWSSQQKIKKAMQHIDGIN